MSLERPGQKAVSKAIITNIPSKRAEEMERNLLNFEDFMKKCVI